jgi:hypothetical protein
MLAGLRKRATERKLSRMRSAKNLHPDWGYVPARKIDFMRAISTFLVATTIGATAGGGMVLSLVDVPTSQASVGAHTLAAPVQALSSAPEAAPNPQPVVESMMDSGANGRLGAAASESSTSPRIVAPAGIARPTDVGLNDASVNVAPPPSAAAAPAESKTTKKRRVATHYVQPDGPFGFGLGGQYPNRAFGGPSRDGRWGGFYQNGANRYHAWGYGRD